MPINKLSPALSAKQRDEIVKRANYKKPGYFGEDSYSGLIECFEESDDLARLIASDAHREARVTELEAERDAAVATMNGACRTYAEESMRLTGEIAAARAEAAALRAVCRSAAGVFKVWAETMTIADAEPAALTPASTPTRHDDGLLAGAEEFYRRVKVMMDDPACGEPPREIMKAVLVDWHRERRASAVPVTAAEGLADGMKWTQHSTGMWMLLNAEGRVLADVAPPSMSQVGFHWYAYSSSGGPEVKGTVSTLREAQDECEAAVRELDVKGGEK